jgi:two-component system sensor histidine kinase BaeS
LTLRTRLFAAIALIVVLSIGVTYAVGLALTRSAVERANLDDLGHQADLLAQQERQSLLPLAHLAKLEPYLVKQHEQARVVDLSRPSPFLPDDARAAVRRGRPVQGHVRIDRKRNLFAARLVAGKGFVVLRRANLHTWTYGRALLIGGLVGAALAALISLLSARAIARPVGRVADASRRLAEGGAPEPVPEQGAAEVKALARAFNETAEQLHQARESERAFLLSVSHELKTPLTAIRGYAEALAEGAVTTDEALATIRREAARLERLVRDLLDLARMNRHEFSVERAEVDLAEVAREAVRRYSGDAGDVRLEAAAAGEARALGDHDRLLQVVSNLVENALRSTPPGGSVTVRAEPGVLVVEDTGLGLPAEDLPRAFERFYLYDRLGAGRRLGTGLGLAIVEELTEAMGGSVEVTSEIGRGTTFTVRLQTGDARPPAPREPRPGPARAGARESGR